MGNFIGIKGTATGYSHGYNEKILLLITFLFSLFIAQAASYYGCYGGRYFWIDVNDQTGKTEAILIFGPCTEGNWIERAYLIPGASIPYPGISDNGAETRLNNASVQGFYTPSPNNAEDVALLNYVAASQSTMPYAYINTDNVNAEMVAKIRSHYK